MNVASVLSFSRAQVQTNSSGLTDPNGLLYANEALSDFHRRLVNADIDASQLAESSITGIAGTGIYPYPSNPSILSLKTMEANYADTQDANYQVVNQVDVSNLPANMSYSFLRANGNPTQPQYDDRGNAFEIFPTPTSSTSLPGLVKLFYYASPSIYGAITDTVNYPENLDVTILGWRIAANYLYSLGTNRIPDGDKFMQRYDDRVKQYISTLSRGGQNQVQATPIQITGWEF